jgi:hypothetical protein
LASAAVLIFLAGRSDLHPDTMPMGVMVDQVFHQEAIRVGLSGPGAAPLRKLIVAYLETRSDPAAVHQAFHLATRHNMTELVPLAVRILRDPQQSAFTRGIAVLLVARVAGPGGRAELEPLLKDETPLTNFQWNGVRGTTELRDVALAGLVHLTNQSGKDYGFIALQKQPNPGLQSPYYLGFANDTARLAALTRWESWVAIQK